jgi:hypothetical protein
MNVLSRDQQIAIIACLAPASAGQSGWGPRFRPQSIVPVPIKPYPHLGLFRFLRLLIFAVKLVRKKPFRGAENSPIAFICDLKKQVRVGLVVLGQGKSAISDRAGVSHGIQIPNATGLRN